MIFIWAHRLVELLTLFYWAVFLDFRLIHIILPLLLIIGSQLFSAYSNVIHRSFQYMYVSLWNRVEETQLRYFVVLNALWMLNVKCEYLFYALFPFFHVHWTFQMNVWIKIRVMNNFITQFARGSICLFIFMGTSARRRIFFSCFKQIPFNFQF